MSATRATLIMAGMLFAMIAVVTGIGAGGSIEDSVIMDGYGISSHVGQH